jgi:hypothetical protein
MIECGECRRNGITREATTKYKSASLCDDCNEKAIRFHRNLKIVKGRLKPKPKAIRHLPFAYMPATRNQMRYMSALIGYGIKMELLSLKGKR